MQFTTPLGAASTSRNCARHAAARLSQTFGAAGCRCFRHMTRPSRQLECHQPTVDPLRVVLERALVCANDAREVVHLDQHRRVARVGHRLELGLGLLKVHRLPSVLGHPARRVNSLAS
eukprot:365323-Chlamydomonas_euryale.AAC.2